MLIYEDNAASTFGGANTSKGYKSTYKRQRSNIQAKTVKSATQGKRRRQRLVKKEAREKKVKRTTTTKTRSKNKKLKTKNIKFLKKLGFQLK